MCLLTVLILSGLLYGGYRYHRYIVNDWIERTSLRTRHHPFPSTEEVSDGHYTDR